MKSNFNRALELVLQHEGGFVNHPSDPGGATNKGVTIGTYRAYINPKGTVEDLKRITKAQIQQVYKKHYWDAVRGDDLPAGVDYAVFDFAVNSGPSRAAKYLQRILMVAQDGVIGPNTLAALSRANPAHVVTVLCSERLKFLKGLSTWPTFGKGWERRVVDVAKIGLEWAEVPETSAPPKTSVPSSPIPVPTSTTGKATAGVGLGAAIIAILAYFWDKIF